ncbi:MAG: hypothetical protein IT580_22320 [Verrucomicrobiales bacterium]|nr:hypothetical protein [Verrucomicrobiales bacterium]
MPHPLPLPTARTLVLAFVLLAAPQPRAAEGKRWTQDRFAIGYWVGPQTAHDAEQRYREIAEANFTLVIGTPAITPDEQLRLCERFGLRAIIEPGQASPLPDGPACWGYQLVDEPNASQFPDLARRAAVIREQRPGRFGYVNLFPNYANTTQLGTPTYEEHVRRFVREVQPEVLSMDHYPSMRPERDGRDAYCDNLELFRRVSLEAGIPHWNYFYSMPFADRIDPTEAQIRWQIFTALAYGSRGILYFCYWTPGRGNGGTGEFPKGGALLTAEGRKTRHYDEARRINAELKHLGPTLMQLTSTGVRRLDTAKPETLSAITPGLRSLKPVAGDPPAAFIVGTFTHQDGRRAVLLVNHSHSFTAWPTVEFEAPDAAVQEISKTDGTVQPVVDDSPELKGLQLSFGAGDGRLFLLPPPR